MADDDAILPFGAYETPLTRRVSERIELTKGVDPYARSVITNADGAHHDQYVEAITRVLADHLVGKLLSTSDAEERVALINSLAALIDPDDRIESEQLLQSVYRRTPGAAPALQPRRLTGAELLTNSGADQNMASEIKREILTADSVDLLCAFIKNSGISVIRDQLEYLRDHSIPLRVITSTYCGASDIQAINRLVDEFGAEVKIGYESQETRLHAKAWLFRRNSGFDTAYIGSSNLSNSALIDGVEWNVRTSRTTTPEILAKFEAVFDTYWNDKHYAHYDPEKDQLRLKQSLKRARFGSDPEQKIELSGLRVEPWHYQEAMLEALRSERKLHDRHRNLIVAATGTGKTVVAALDYRGIVEETKRKPSLLFVAHRSQLLRQAQRTYQEVLGDPSFGEIWDGNNKPTVGTHLFATIQSLHRNLDSFPSNFYQVVVIDEFHHAEASTYRKLLDHVTPQELLGLTATPERGDGTSVEKFFDYRIAYELRLWDAFQLDLVAPMHYYGVDDGTDLSDVKWSRANKAYDTKELTDYYLKYGDLRVRLILRELEKRVFDLDALKAIGFCVSITHAEFMAARFTELGLPAAAVTSQISEEERKRSINALRSGDLKVLFTVDLFNEGVDIPEVNTLLLLRPTESPVIFLQQLGRGLRKSPGKVCTVLDFLGLQHTNFDYGQRYAALTGKRGKRLEAEVSNDFPSLPGGTHVQLDRMTRERALSNIKQLANNKISRIRNLIEQEATLDLQTFLGNTHLELEDLYRNSKQGGWTRLLRSQGLLDAPEPFDSTEDFLLGRIRSLLHVNDRKRAEAYVEICRFEPAASFQDLSEDQQAYAKMLIVQVWANTAQVNRPKTWDDALTTIRTYPAFADEIEQVFRYRVDQTRVQPEAVTGPGAGVLFTHADYSVAELTAALKQGPIEKLLNLPREGVHYIEEQSLDLLFVTLVKDEDRFSETTMYRDYPISRELFQWESQSTTTLSSKTGQRYIHHECTGHAIYLCVRNTRQNSIGVANPYTLLGDVTHVRHQGEKPIRFEWKLSRPMPAVLYEQGRAVI